MHIRQFLVVVTLLVGSLKSVAADRPTIELWPEGMPDPQVAATGPEKVEKTGGIARRSNVTKPRLVVFEAPAEKRTGAAAIVVPGGGFGILADEHEGSDACEWLNSIGITSFLLQHRCPTNKHPEPNVGPVQDTQRAVQLVRGQTEKWKLDGKKIGVLGFSAGGQVAAVAATDESLLVPVRPQTRSHKLDFLVLVYPWRIYDEKTKKLRADLHPETLPPTFIAQCADDTGSLPQGTALLFLELVNRKIPAELHIYEKGGHGFGMQPRPNATGPTDWTHRAADWLRLRGLAKAEAK